MVIFKTMFMDVSLTFLISPLISFHLEKKSDKTLSMISIEATCRLLNATLSFLTSGLDVSIYIKKLICTC